MSHKTRHNQKTAANPAKPTPKKIDPTVVVAIIGLIGTITVAFLGFSPFINWLNFKLTPTPTNTIETPILLSTETPTSTVEFTPNETETFTPPPPDTPTVTASNPEKMTALLRVSANSGKAPFQVNFNAQDSFITFTNGTTSSCFNNPNACTFTWTVSLGGKIVYGPKDGGAGFSYKFEKKGVYFVTVTICRGYTCNNSSTAIDSK